MMPDNELSLLAEPENFAASMEKPLTPAAREDCLPLKKRDNGLAATPPKTAGVDTQARCVTPCHEQRSVSHYPNWNFRALPENQEVVHLLADGLHVREQAGGAGRAACGADARCARTVRERYGCRFPSEAYSIRVYSPFSFFWLHAGRRFTYDAPSPVMSPTEVLALPDPAERVAAAPVLFASKQRELRKLIMNYSFRASLSVKAPAT